MPSTDRPVVSRHGPQIVGVDTGGTFTDFVCHDDEGLRTHKLLSTPAAPEQAILAGLAALNVDPLRARLVHGSTVGTNAVLEGRGARTAFVTNRGLADLLACAQAQGTVIEKHDILLIRTGWLTVFYDQGPAVFYAEPFLEPGLTFSRELVEWFHDMEIPLLGTDTIANEVTVDPESGLILPLHSALMRNLGVIFNEILWLEDLAGACAADGQYKFFYTAAPLKVFRGTGAPVNPIAIR